MPLPAGVEQVTVVSGQPLVLPDGTWIKGKLWFAGPGLGTIAAQDLTFGGGVPVDLINGAFSVKLIANDATGINPAGGVYKVTSEFDNADNWVRYVSLPKALTSPVAFADVVVPDPVAAAYTVLLDQVAADARYVLKSGAGLAAQITAIGQALAAGSTGAWADAGHVHTVDTWTDSDNNLVWANYQPELAGTSTNPIIATAPGKLTLHRAMIRTARTITNVLFGLSAVDVTGPISNSFIGLYDSTGTLRASTADISATLMSSATVKTVPFTSPYAAPAGEYFLALLLNGTWSTSLQFKSCGGGVTSNAGLAAPHLVLSSMSSGLTSLPSAITLSSQATALITGGWGSQWYGLS